MSNSDMQNQPAGMDFMAGVVEQAPDAIIVIDASGTVRIWNKRAEEIYGFSPQEAVQGGLDLIIPPHLREAHARGFHSAMAAGKVKSPGRAARTRATHKSGAKLYVEMSFSVLSDDSGKAVGAIAIARDVTDRPKPTSA